MPKASKSRRIKNDVEFAALQKRIKDYKRQWCRENILRIIIACLIWVAVIIAAKMLKADAVLLGLAGGILAALLYIKLHHQMMIYVEANAFEPKLKR